MAWWDWELGPLSLQPTSVPQLRFPGAAVSNVHGVLVQPWRGDANGGLMGKERIQKRIKKCTTHEHS